MPVYIFEGSDMIEVSGDGTRRVVNSMASPPPNIERRSGFDVQRSERTYPGSPYSGAYGQTNYRSYTPDMDKPWTGVDSKKWPATWRTLVKLYFLPSYYKDSKWVEKKITVVGKDEKDPYQWEGSM